MWGRHDLTVCCTVTVHTTVLGHVPTSSASKSVNGVRFRGKRQRIAPGSDIPLIPHDRVNPHEPESHRATGGSSAGYSVTGRYYLSSTFGSPRRGESSRTVPSEKPARGELVMYLVRRSRCPGVIRHYRRRRAVLWPQASGLRAAGPESPLCAHHTHTRDRMLNGLTGVCAVASLRQLAA